MKLKNQILSLTIISLITAFTLTRMALANSESPLHPELAISTTTTTPQTPIIEHMPRDKAKRQKTTRISVR